MRTVPLLLSIALISLGIGGGVGYWQMYSANDYYEDDFSADEIEDQNKVQALLEHFHPTDASKILAFYRGALSENSDIGRKWISLAILTAIELRDKQELSTLYSEYPEWFYDDEPASLLVAEYFLQNQQLEKFSALRSRWATLSAQFPEKWIILDSNRLEMEGLRNEAIVLLASQAFQGEKDTNRLVRLAMLSIPESPSNAWDYLSEALKKDPRNPDLRMYRAKLLEAENRPSLALSEFTTAVQTDPKNPFIRDQLVEFHVKQQQFPEALRVLAEGLQYPTIDATWLKVAFWEKVAGPANVQWSKYEIPLGNVKPFIDYIIALPEDQFWDAKAFQKLPNYQHYLKTQPVSVWLRFFDLLKKGRENDAAELLVLNPFQTSYLNPELETGFRRILNYRLNGSLVLNDALYESINGYPSDNSALNFDALPFLDQLTVLAKQEASDPQFVLPQKIQNLLQGPLAYVSLLLSQNWNQAAIILNPLTTFPENIPSWVAYKMTRAIQGNYGVVTALQFANQQPQSPEMELRIAELLILKKASNDAIDILSGLRGQPGDVGSRATWLLSLVYIDQKKFDLARETILSNPKLLSEVTGQEGLARIALLEGHADVAERIYESLQEHSAEARSFLARKAFMDKDWARARALTIALIQEFPNNQVLRENLSKINSEMKLTSMRDGKK